MKALLAAICAMTLIVSVAAASDDDTIERDLTSQGVVAQLTPTPPSHGPAPPGSAQQDLPQQVPVRQPATPQAQTSQKQTTVPSTPAPPAPRNWTTTFSTESRYFSWHNNFVLLNGNPGHGWEFYQPVAVQLSGKPADTLSVDFIVRSGWVKAVQSTTGLSGSVQTPTDTVASGTLTYLGWQGVQPFVSLNANLPTGQAALLGTVANARMDPDFVDVSIFGEGLNLGPTAGFNFPIMGSLLITTSVGYTWRGRFNQDSAALAQNPLSPLSFLGPVSSSNVEPGDTLTITGAVNYLAGSFSTSLTGTVTWETPTTVDGTRTLKPGNRYLLALQSSYLWSGALGTTTLTAAAAHSNRNKVFLPEINALVEEALNSNSNVYRVGVQHLLPFGNLQVGPTGSVLYRDQNGYNSATLQFVPQKTRWSAGILAQYAASATMTLNARVEGVWTHENENPAPDGNKLDALQDFILPASIVPSVSGTGWQTSIGINVKL